MAGLIRSKALAVFAMLALSVAAVVGLAAMPASAYAVSYTTTSDYAAFMEDTDIYINRSKVNWNTATVTTNTAQGMVFKENLTGYAETTVDGDKVYSKSTSPVKGIVYSGSGTGTLTIPNAYTVRYSKVAVTADGEVCDLIVKCTSLTLDANTPRNESLGITRISQPGSEGYEVYRDHSHATGDRLFVPSTEHPGYYTKPNPRFINRVTETMQVYCVKTGTDTRIKERFTMYLFDLDTSDYGQVPGGYGTIWCESVQVRSGVGDVAISNKSVLDTSRAAADGIFMATQGTETLDSNPSIWDSGVVLRSDSNGLISYAWRAGASLISTSLGFGMPGTVLGGFSFQKLDADLNVFSSQGNGNLSSVRFDVFRDEACTQRVMTMTVKPDGTVTTGKGVLDLANNPYYVKEVSATGYNVNATPFVMVATRNGG